MEKQIIFTGLCFWSTQAIFQRIKGITSTLCGYYYIRDLEFSINEDDRLESVLIGYNEEEITFHSLLDIYFLTHNPALISWNIDECFYPLCRPAILYFNEQDEVIITKKMEDFKNKSQEPFYTKKFKADLNCFIKSSEYDQNFYNKKTQDSFSCVNITPKIEKIKLHFPDFFKDIK